MKKENDVKKNLTENRYTVNGWNAKTPINQGLRTFTDNMNKRHDSINDYSDNNSTSKVTNSYTFNSVYEFASSTSYNLYQNNSSGSSLNSLKKKKVSKKYVLKSPKRFLRFALSMFLLISILTGVSSIIFNESEAIAQTGAAYNLHVVSPGDTLWSIAESEMPDDMDIREAINILEDINNIESVDIYTGLTLKIPV